MIRTLSAAMVLAMAPTAAAAEVSTTDRLPDRREVAAGDRAYAVGFADGGWYANGWHITGEMGGVWAPPNKLADGIWFGVDDQWIGSATRFTTGDGYVRYDLPATGGLVVKRTDFVPDGKRAAVFGLHLTNPGREARTVAVKADVHSELLPPYPWTWTTPGADSNRPDTAAATQDGALAFTDGAMTAFAGSDRKPTSTETGAGYRGPRPGTVCQPDMNPAPAPSACDDGPHGRGAGGRLSYKVIVKPRATETVWVAIAATRADLAGATSRPEQLLERKAGSRAAVAARSRVDLPGDRTLQTAVDAGKQNLADLTQTATDLQLRFVDEGKAYPPPLGTIDRVTFIGAGYPDYPWLFATDGEYTAFAAVALGQFEPIKEHLIALQRVSDLLNERSGKVAHEIVTDGSVYFGANQDPGNTDESAKFPSAVALVWRWSGDNRFRDRLYDLSKRAAHHVVDTLDADGDGWPEGRGNVEREGMGEEKLDNTVYLIRGLRDLADMAESKGDTATRVWAQRRYERLLASFDRTWWDPASTQYADSLGDANARIQQQHWIGVTPMETGIAPRDHANTALDQRETDCFSGTAPFNRGLFHTGCTGGPEGKGERIVFSLNTAIKAVGDGEYGRDAQRYLDANAGELQDEQPGALPEILNSPDQNRNIDRCWTCRSMFMQAWGHYGTAWPVIAQQLGVKPDLGRGALAVVPDVPDGQPYVAGEAIRIGDGEVAVRATRNSTTVAVRGVRELTLGVTLPHGAKPREAKLDGRRVKPTVTATNRGVEVTVRAPAHGRHTLEVRP